MNVRKLRNWRVIVFVAALGIAFIVIPIVTYDWVKVSISGGGNDYDMYIKPQIQDAVTAYIAEHNGSLPPTLKGSADVYPQVNTSGGVIINTSVPDLCALVEPPKLLRDIPDGVSDTGTLNNFWNASSYSNCENTGGTQHYIWTIDADGNVYSVCDENEDGDWLDIGVETGLHETVDGYHDEVWP